MPDLSDTSSVTATKAQSKAIALFVSDVHLQPSLPRTTQAFIAFLQQHATKANQVYFLGDLFEYWAGDDDIDAPYHQQICAALAALANAGTDIFCLAGNRDFLVGDTFAKVTGVKLLPDPFVAEIGSQRVALTHGDAQCTDDRAYMEFRAQVRQPEWQRNFLSMPLAQRKAIIDNMRNGSREAQRAKSYETMDVNAGAIAALYDATDTAVMIHGHTHRPATHCSDVDGKKRVRYVLPDWDCDAEVPRGGWLSMDDDGRIRRFQFDGTECQTA